MTDIPVDGGSQGGTGTLNTAVSNTTVSIVRNTPIDRTEDFPYPSSTLNIEALNTGLDRIAAWAQQLFALLSRTLAQPTTDAAELNQLPAAASRAGKFMAFDSTGQTLMAASLGVGRGVWATDTVYNQGDSVEDGAAGDDTGNGYTCAVPHTSGTWSTDLAAGYWKLAVRAGATGPSGGVFIENTISTNTSLGVGQTLQNYVCESALTLTVAESTTLNKQWQNLIFAEGGAVTIAPNAADKINGGTIGASFVVSQGNYGVLTTDANGNLYVEVSVGPLVSPSGANPSATIAGGAAINGSAATFMRSDATPALALTNSSAALASDIAISNSAYTDGPTLSLGTGVWLVIANITIDEAAGAAAAIIQFKLWDGTTVMASGETEVAASVTVYVSVAGIIINPTGNVKFSCTSSLGSSDTVMKANITGDSKDSTIKAVRIG